MKDYRCTSMLEASQSEIAEQFINSIKTMARGVAISRLRGLLHANKSDENFISIAGQFNALVNTLTSVDTE